MRRRELWFRARDEPRRACAEHFGTRIGPKRIRTRTRYRGGGGLRVRVHVLDSESGGAKGHYPNRTTMEGDGGSMGAQKFLAPATARIGTATNAAVLLVQALDDGDPHRIATAVGIAVERGAQLAGEADDDPLETLAQCRIAFGVASQAVSLDR